jgi:Uma2 family endonuclease
MSRSWTKAEYYRMDQLGWFLGQRTELVEGEIVVLSPQGPRHFLVVQRVTRILEKVFATGFDVRMQGPFDLGTASEPEPDVAVVPGRAEDYAQAHPRTAALIVEVSDATLAYDRRRKASLYARAGIADYWIVNLVDEKLEILGNPRADSTQPFGFGYVNVTILHDGDDAVPLAQAQAIPVADLFS